LALFTAFVPAQKPVAGSNRPGTTTAIAKLEKDIPALMKAADVPGVSAALVRDGKIVWSKGFGVQNAEETTPVTNETVFEAASLTKVVFTYGVLKLVDEGRLDLDTPLNKYLGNNYEVAPDDARIDQITARRVLTHTSGFPNWRAQGAKFLPINFMPGEKFSYSGEGFVYLSKVVEKITGMKWEDYLEKTVLQPLKMTSSSLVWQDRYEKIGAYRHDMMGKKEFRNQGKDSNAAASLRTTAEDYARFLIALMSGKGLKKKTFDEMFKPQIVVNEKSPQVAWGLGTGLETTGDGKYFWHWGDQGTTKAYFTGDLRRKDAIVYFANGMNGLSFTTEILADAVGGAHPAVAFLNYERYDSPARELLKEILAKGAAQSLENYRAKRARDAAQAIGENGLNNMGYALLRWKKIDDAIEVFRQNTVDFPNSANTWDSLAEAYMTKGENASAIKYYEKSLELNPKNNNAIEQLKKLKP
jgi:CubicO group peptidase (beta-lactamase class C family)